MALLKRSDIDFTIKKWKNKNWMDDGLVRHSVLKMNDCSFSVGPIHNNKTNGEGGGEVTEEVSADGGGDGLTMDPP